MIFHSFALLPPPQPQHIKGRGTLPLIPNRKQCREAGNCSTWDDGRLGGGPESVLCSLRFPLLVFGNHVDFILSVPVKRLQHDVVASRREPNLWFPIGGMLLQKWGWGGGGNGQKDAS